jgi:hypothetical protein
MMYPPRKDRAGCSLGYARQLDSHKGSVPSLFLRGGEPPHRRV